MKKTGRWMMGLAAAMMLAAPSIQSFADAAPDGKTVATGTEFENWKANVWENTLKNDWTQVSMTPGADASEMNFAWYSQDGQTTSFTWGRNKDLSDGTKADIKSGSAQTGYKSNKVTLKGLEENTTYYYQVEGKEVASFKTGDTDSFHFAFVGDPQIGSSNEEKAKKPSDIAKDTFKKAQSDSVASDSYNWSQTLDRALAKQKDLSFVVSAGDQIQTNAKKVEDNTVSEIEYAGYLSPAALKFLPVATTVGNHDADNANYQYHFNVPNLSDLGDNGYVGGDYYFTYGDVLFMMLNTQDTNSAEHVEFMKNTVAQNPDCKWIIVTLHQDIYGSAEHSNEPEIVNLRYALTPAFEECGVDVVLTGHDHAYTRSKFISGGTETKTITYTDDDFDTQLEKDMDAGEDPATLHTAPGNIQDDTTDADEKAYLEYLKSVMDEELITSDDTTYAVNPQGILYMTASSSSGSKYYDLVPRMQSYVANRWQEDVPTYSIVDVTETALTINTYRTDTNEKIDTSLTIVKTTDKEALQLKVNEIKAAGLTESDYTAASWEALVQAQADAQAVLENEQATEQQVTDALQNLIAAYDGLEKVPMTDGQDKNDGKDNDNANGGTVDKGNTDNAGNNGADTDKGNKSNASNTSGGKGNAVSKAAKTGDTTNMALPVIVCVAAAGMAGVIVYRKKAVK